MSRLRVHVTVPSMALGFGDEDGLSKIGKLSSGVADDGREGERAGWFRMCYERIAKVEVGSCGESLVECGLSWK